VNHRITVSGADPPVRFFTIVYSHRHCTAAADPGVTADHCKKSTRSGLQFRRDSLSNRLSGLFLTDLPTF